MNHNATCNDASVVIGAFEFECYIGGKKQQGMLHISIIALFEVRQVQIRRKGFCLRFLIRNKAQCPCNLDQVVQLSPIEKPFPTDLCSTVLFYCFTIYNLKYPNHCMEQCNSNMY